MFVYNFFISVYAILIKAASFSNFKAKQWVFGRKNWRRNLTLKVSYFQTDNRVWFHCASFGEFEQGRPLIEAFKKKYPEYKIILSFFSPSGYEYFKEWTGADLVCYLPLDTKQNAIDFINIINPKIVFFIKYEFWINFLRQLKKRNITTYLVSAVFKKHQPFFKWYGSIFKSSLVTYKQLFIQDENSAELLSSIGILNHKIFGDTRFDRVLKIKEDFIQLPYFDEFCRNKKVIVAGSTWTKDEEILVEVFNKINISDLILVLVPHQVDVQRISELKKVLALKNIEFNVYSSKKIDVSKKVLIVDTIGLLSQLYHYANIAYIGGGFNSGIHNCLEPAVFFKPILFFGNGYQKFNEVNDLIDLKLAKNFSTSIELEKYIKEILNNKNLIEIENKFDFYFKNKMGVSKKILEEINF